MAKRIWFNTEKVKSPPYFSLRWGLGEFDEASAKVEGEGYGYCLKLYTTRLHPLKGEYVVVEGSRFRAKAVEPRIEFQVTMSVKLDLRHAVFEKGDTICGWAIANRDGLTCPEHDLGVVGKTYLELCGELLQLNRGATLDTPFFVNLIEKI
jgi:hypothetical protein